MSIDEQNNMLIAAITQRLREDIFGMEPQASQSDAAIMTAMARQSLEDAECITEMLDAGCSMDECAAAFSDGRAVN